MENILRIQFAGRLCRSRFWSTYIVLYVLSFFLGVVLGALLGLAEDSSNALILYLAALLVFLAIIYLCLVQLGLGARRLHDIELSGWWQLITLIPYAGLIALIVLFFQDSKPGSNQWGPNPKELA